MDKASLDPQGRMESALTVKACVAALARPAACHKRHLKVSGQVLRIPVIACEQPQTERLP